MLLCLKKMATRVFPGYAGSRRPFSSLVKSIELPELQAIDSVDVMVAQRPQLISAALKPSVTRLRSEFQVYFAERNPVRPHGRGFSLSETSGHTKRPLRAVVLPSCPVLSIALDRLFRLNSVVYGDQ